MSDTVIVIAEIILGIAILGVLSAVITVVMTRALDTGSRAEAILRERYARGELTGEEFARMRGDLGIGATMERRTSPADGGSAEATSAAGAPR